jgi:hypothetical protein
MTYYGRILVAAVLLLTVGALACVGGPQKPSVEILSPPSGSRFHRHHQSAHPRQHADA